MDESTMTAFVASALALLKERLDRLPEDTTRDTYFTRRIEQAVEELQQTGIKLRDDSNDLLLVVDYAAWSHANRDKPGGMPEWLRLRRRERWLSQRAT